jgi:ribosomal-protein-serine acetyltransferase
MLLAELELWHTRPRAPTRRLSLGNLVLPVDPPQYGFSYWVDHDATGNGYTTAACAGVLDYARSQLGASDVYAGVVHGNDASVALLRRLGFAVSAEFDEYTRFHLRLADL